MIVSHLDSTCSLLFHSYDLLYEVLEVRTSVKLLGLEAGKASLASLYLSTVPNHLQHSRERS